MFGKETRYDRQNQMNMRCASSTALFFILLFISFFSTVQISACADRGTATPGDVLYENNSEYFDGDELDAVLEGFDEKPKETSSQEEFSGPGIFGIDGDLSLETAFSPGNDDSRWDGLTRLRTELFLELNGDFSESWKMRLSGRTHYDFAYGINRRSQYTREVKNEYEDETELFEAYVNGSLLGNLDIKVGRQIIVWGKSDYIRVTDILNPLDMRVPGLTDIEYLRLPVTMTRVDFYWGIWDLTGIAVHEHRYDKRPAYGSDFYFFSGPEPREIRPASNLKNTEYALALNGIFSGWDISFYFADVFDDEPHVDWISAVMRHEPITMIGISTNVATGNWLLIGEAAHFSGMNFSVPSGKNFSRTDVLTGIEYSGIRDVTINVEAVNRHVHDYIKELKEAPVPVKRNLIQTVFRISRQLMHETLTLSFLALTYGASGRDGAIQRLSAEYDVSDQIQVTCTAALYGSGDLKQFEDIGDNDRLFLEFKYFF